VVFKAIAHSNAARDSIAFATGMYSCRSFHSTGWNPKFPALLSPGNSPFFARFKKKRVSHAVVFCLAPEVCLRK